MSARHVKDFQNALGPFPLQSCLFRDGANYVQLY